jgi:pimeloyl-ACP methyl ester carboxylesterase
LDLRGHGQSEGVVVSFGDREVLDLEAGLHRLAAQPGVSCSRIGILAASMGGGIALADSAYLADFGVAGIVGFAPASDYGVIIDSSLPAGPMRQVLSTTLDTITRALGPHPPRELDAAGAIARAGVPVLVFHGRSDSTVPPEATQRLADLAPNVRVVWMDTASHADLPDIVLASRPLRHQVLAFLGLDD